MIGILIAGICIVHIQNETKDIQFEMNKVVCPNCNFSGHEKDGYNTIFISTVVTEDGATHICPKCQEIWFNEKLRV